MTHKLYINTRNGLEVIRLDDVAYLKADGNYTEFHFIDGKERVQLSTLSVYADAISRVFSASNTPSPFYRMGRSWIVNLDHVSSVDNRVGGKRSSFLPTFVFRPLTPPYVPFGIRRFQFWVPFEIRIRETQVARLL